MIFTTNNNPYTRSGVLGITDFKKRIERYTVQSGKLKDSIHDMSISLPKRNRIPMYNIVAFDREKGLDTALVSTPKMIDSTFEAFDMSVRIGVLSKIRIENTDCLQTDLFNEHMLRIDRCNVSIVLNDLIYRLDNESAE
ncbi:hypothetical protein MHBO_004899, partial [Bonamia ostreae]